MKPEDRYTAGLGGRKSSWDTMSENTVKDISTSASDLSGEKYVQSCCDRVTLAVRPCITVGSSDYIRPYCLIWSYEICHGNAARVGGLV